MEGEVGLDENELERRQLLAVLDKMAKRGAKLPTAAAVNGGFGMGVGHLPYAMWDGDGWEIEEATEHQLARLQRAAHFENWLGAEGCHSVA